MHYPPSFSTPVKTCLWERRTYFVVGMRYITWPEFTEKQKWFCGTTVGFMFAFLLLWLAGNSVAWAEWLPVSVWCYLSANARFSCQEIKPTQYTFIAKNDVKFFLLCFIYLFFQNRIATIFALPGSLASVSVPAGPTWLCFAWNNVCCFSQELDSAPLCRFVI